MKMKAALIAVSLLAIVPWSLAQLNLPAVIGNILGPDGVISPISLTLLELTTPNEITILNLTLPVIIDNNQVLNVSVLVQLRTFDLTRLTLYVEATLNGVTLLALPIALDLSAVLGLLGLVKPILPPFHGLGGNVDPLIIG